MNDVRLIAFYLPQFHPISENDEWWGKGFTEWTNVSSAKPIFPGHYQPHIPADLGFYDLRLAEVREEQARLAQEYGIYGFCYYYYYFNGKRLLNRPLDDVLASGKPDFPFCVCWANENWTRKWDGKNDDILIEQVHSINDDKNFIHQLIPVLQDKRYIRVNNNLLLLVYRAELLPDPNKTAATWRKIVRKEMGEELYLCAVNNFVKEIDPTSIGFDGTVQFPMVYTTDIDIDKRLFAAIHEINFPDIQHNCLLDYPGAMNLLVKVQKPNYTFFRGVFPAWDNTPRRPKTGTVFINSSPELYKLYLKTIIGLTEVEHTGDERLVFINAWNEWAEGAHLEPDKKYGLRFLEATREALNENNDYKLLMKEINERDSESRMFYSSAGKLTDKVIVAEKKIKELNQIIDVQRARFDEEKAVLSQKTEDKDQQIVQFGRLLEQKELLINETENQILEKEKHLQDKENQLQNKEIQFQDKENLILEKERQLHEQATQIISVQNRIHELENQALQRDHDVKETFIRLEELSSQLSRKEEIIRIIETSLTEKEEIIRIKEQYIHTLFNSSSWKITKPLRWLHTRIFSIFYIFFPYGSKRWAFVKRLVQKKHLIILSKHNETVESNPEKVEKNFAEALKVDIEKKSDETKYNSSFSVLFVGHDAYLAGAQVLLLSLIKWMSEHTGITLKIILLRDGVLLDKFKKIAPVLVWEDLINSCPNENEKRTIIQDFVGKVDLIYGNTVVVPAIYDELKFLEVPHITHVHELEKSINTYVSRGTVDKMHLLTDGYIAGSNPVCINLIRNHSIDEKDIVVINDFIEKRETNFAYSKKDLRKKLGLIEDGLIILGCGTIYWRKGVDLFMETALMLKQKGYSNFHFYWIGENVWDKDHASNMICSWNTLEHKFLTDELKNHITFLGVKENFYDYFLAGDLFYLSSREDPFPLVCLEAAQACMPIICFEDAGGIPDFVQQDAGFIVPFEDIPAVVDKIIFFERNKHFINEIGLVARKKFLERHTIDIAAPEILKFCQKIGSLHPAVSVIVPNYNYEKFLEKRLNSILNQTFKDFEIILLDDASSDNSLEIIGKYLNFPNVRFLGNHFNSGNTFKQWHKGFSEAKGEIIWFAEADDFCEPDFLEKLLPSFNNACVALAYCDTLMVDESDNILGDYSSWVDNLDPLHWKSSYQVTGLEEINFGLGVKNSIPNASAVLIRKSCVSESFFDETFKFKYSGDWYFYTQVIKGKDIAFCSEKLNYQRKHNKTVTSSSIMEDATIQLLLKEQEIIHEHILQSFDIDSGFLNKWEIHLANQLNAWYPTVSKNNFNKYYPYKLTKEKIQKAIVKSNQKGV